MALAILGAGCAGRSGAADRPGATPDGRVSGVWAQRLGAPGHVAGLVAGGGGALAVGTFRGALREGGPPSRGGDDGFVAWLTPRGAVGWAVGIGGADGDAVTCAAAGPHAGSRAGEASRAAADAFVVAGTFQGEADLFGERRTAGGRPDGFFARLDARGARLEVGVLPATGYTLPRGVALGPDGALAVVGQFSGALTVGGRELVGAGGGDGFVALFERGGALRWAHRFGGAGADLAAAVAFLPDGRLVVGGQVGPGDDLGAHAGHDAAPDGVLVMADADRLVGLGVGAAGADQIAALAPWDGAIAIAGSFAGDQPAAGEGAARGAAEGGADGFVAVIDLTGVPRWSVAIGVAGAERVSAIAAGRQLAVAGSAANDGAGGLRGFAAIVDKDGAGWRVDIDGAGEDAATAAAWLADGSLLVGGGVGGAASLAGLRIEAPSGFAIALSPGPR